jgi:hypothetical protein
MVDNLNISLAPQVAIAVDHEMGGDAGFTIVAGISRSTGGGAGNEYLNSEKVKLAGIETGATADQTASEIKTLYESNANTNEYDDAEQAKLAAIEPAATADQTGAEIKIAYEAELNTNAYTDAAVAKLAGIEAGATADQSNAEIKTAYELNANTNAFTDAEKTKLTGVESGATADQTNGEIKTAYEANANTNAYTDAEVSKLAGIEVAATADQSNSEIEIGYNAQVAKISAGEITAGTEVNVRRVSPADLKSIVLAHETGGGGGDPNPVQVSAPEIAAGTETALRSYSPADVVAIVDAHAPVGGGGLSNIVEDLTPQLGGNLDTQTFTVDGRDVGTDGTKLDGIEVAATADQTDGEIETAYNNQVAKISAGEITAGTETAVRRYSPADVVAIIAAHESGGGSSTTVNTKTGTAETLALTDANDIVEMNNAAANVLTIPTNAAVAFSTGDIITVEQEGAGATTITADTGVTLNGVSAGSATITAQYDAVSLYKRGTDDWRIQGAHGGVA